MLTYAGEPVTVAFLSQKETVSNDAILSVVRVLIQILIVIRSLRMIKIEIRNNTDSLT